MTQYVRIVFCVFIVTFCSAELKCGVSEVEESCPADCETDVCPKHENYIRSCERPNKCPSPACKCRFNYSRANNGTCVPTRQCPEFPCSGRNEQYVSCPPYCPTDDCSQATPDGRCLLFGSMLVVVPCRPTCRCKEGYWRDKGACVPYAECPNRGNDMLNGLSPFW